MNKVLIITYYWPPSGGSGVQRWLKFVKYLPSYDWEPHVFTPENPSFGILDPSLEKDVPAEAEVMHFPIWEPYDIFYKLSGWFSPKKKEAMPATAIPSGKRSFFENFSAWIRGNLFIPDPRVFWVKPSVTFLTDYIAHNDIRIVVTTGPPHSVHLIGMKLKARLPHLRWLADFRDPWTEWGIWDSLRVSAPVRSIHRRMEKRVLTEADEIITITPFYVKRFELLSGRAVRLVTNGYDDEDFRELVHTRTDRFVVRHVGIVNEKCDPRPFMQALKNALRSDPEFAQHISLEFTGAVHADFVGFVMQDPELKRITTFEGNIAHDDLIKRYGSSSLLLLILTGYKDAQGFLPGKLFEYLATGLPVLGVGPAVGDAARLLTETDAGVMLEGGNAIEIEAALLQYYRVWKTGEAGRFDDRSGARKQYSRRNITGALATILSEQLGK